MKVNKEQFSLAPTDLSSFLSCKHHARRDLDVAMGQAERPIRFGPILDELQERGRAHEQHYYLYLKDQGLTVARIGEADQDDTSDDVFFTDTLTAMQSGVDIIFQAPLKSDQWSGRADFLCRVDTPSELGGWSYEVVDTKLARDTRAGTILQLCVYTYLLESIQGIRPEFMYVVTPHLIDQPITYRTDDFGAYFRLLQRDLAEFINEPTETYPEPVSHCDLCAWWSECEQRRRSDDHLGYVAGINKSQIESLKEFGITKLSELALLSAIPKPAKGSIESLTRVRDQASAQLKGRELGEPFYELKQPLADQHGLALLPEPTPDDIFLDFEGNHFAEQGVQEYLTGYLAADEDGTYQYYPLWAKTLEEEKGAFENFIETAIKTRDRNPTSHIYHFAPYEPAALKRLMGRFAACEIELDRLLRGNVFVDLHAVVKRALIASVERYSIKELEPFFGYKRKQDLHEASLSRRLVEQALEIGEFDEVIEDHCQIIEDYNREDCESALKLRNWLEELRVEVIKAGAELPRPIINDGEASETISELDQQLQNLRDALLDGIPIDLDDRTDEQQGRYLLAHMMEFHRREEKATWWELFRLLDLDLSDFPDEKRAVAGLQFLKEVQSGVAPVHRYSFATQEIDARVGDDLKKPNGTAFGKVEAISISDQTLDIKKRKDTAVEHASDLVLFNRVPADVLRQSLMRLGEHVINHGFNNQVYYSTAIELLLNKPSPLVNGESCLQHSTEKPVEAACRLSLALDGNVLAIQGPPGAGKTYTGAKIICALKQQGLKVGVTAVSHKVILNLLEGAAKEAGEQGIDIKVSHYKKGVYDGNWPISNIQGYPKTLQNLDQGGVDILGATAWCWSREDFAQSVDVLIVDEAGQMSLSNVLAASQAGRSLILLGDPQQLEQPLQSSHPEGSEVSALAHIIGNAMTISPDRGLFLDETYRLHPDITRFTSEISYQGKLGSRPELINQSILVKDEFKSRFIGSGLQFVPVSHQGNQARSIEEVEVIGGIVEELLTRCRWQDKEGQIHNITVDDVLVIAPYNAQVGALVEGIPDLKHRIGTVDRFQGQEAPVVIYSMTSSHPNDVPRGMEFLYDPHRFNVATSRARALCILVGATSLFEPECNTPKQMAMANGFCRYLELARKV